MTSNKITLSRDSIKYIAMVTMLLNHIAAVFLTRGTLIYEIFTDIGYFTAPCMLYFLVEGYEHTSSKRRYGTRLLVFALISEIPFCLAFTEGTVISFVAMNMIYTLFICFLLLYVRENVQNKLIKGVLLLVLILATVMSDWSILAPLITLFFANSDGTYEDNKTAFIKTVFLFGLFNFVNTDTPFTVQNIVHTLGTMVGPALSATAILFFYNGGRSQRRSAVNKWFFYIFYPAHLLILGLLRVLI